VTQWEQLVAECHGGERMEVQKVVMDGVGLGRVGDVAGVESGCAQVGLGRAARVRASTLDCAPATPGASGG